MKPTRPPGRTAPDSGTRLNVGGRIRQTRTLRGMIIDDVAKKTGLSKAYISQVETGKASPSLRTLERLAQALNAPLTYFFLDDTFGCHVVRKGERKGVVAGAPGKLAYFLSAPNRQLEMVLLEIPVGFTADGRALSQEGEECHVVLKGRLRAVQGDRHYILEEGDSFHWDASVPHWVDNIGSTPATVLVAMTPPGFLNVTMHEARGARHAGEGPLPGQEGPGAD